MIAFLYTIIEYNITYLVNSGLNLYRRYYRYLLRL